MSMKLAFARAKEKENYINYQIKAYGYSEKKASKMWEIKCLFEDPHYDQETGKACYRALVKLNKEV